MYKLQLILSSKHLRYSMTFTNQSYLPVSKWKLLSVCVGWIDNYLV